MCIIVLQRWAVSTYTSYILPRLVMYKVVFKIGSRYPLKKKLNLAFLFSSNQKGRKTFDYNWITIKNNQGSD